MDFDEVVERVRQLHLEGRQVCREEVQLAEGVYGRICNSINSCPPERLTTTPGRKTAFVFGPDAISSIVLMQNSYEALMSMGFTREYIYHELVEKKYTFWLLLFKCTASSHKDFFIAPATWEGVERVISTCYPRAYEDLITHMTELTNTKFSVFEQQAGFEFLRAKKNEDGSLPGSPAFYSYKHFCSLPSPRTAWQVRLFLYCELRLLELFKGDGVTRSESGEEGCTEYLCPNVALSDFDPRQCALIPLNVVIPMQS